MMLLVHLGSTILPDVLGVVNDCALQLKGFLRSALRNTSLGLIRRMSNTKGSTFLFLSEREPSLSFIRNLLTGATEVCS